MAILIDAVCAVQDKIGEASSYSVLEAASSVSSSKIAEAAAYITLETGAVVKETTKNLIALGNLKLTDAYNTVYLPSTTWA